jgi:hypothetical protein
MRFPRASRILPTVVIAASLVAVGTGCTAVGPGAASSGPATSAPAATAGAGSTGAASGQTKTTACQILGSSLQTLSTNLQSAYDKYSSDPKAAIIELQTVSTTFQASVAKVNEPGAQALADKLQTDLQTLVADTKDAVSNPIAGAAKVAKLAPTLKSDITKIGSYCS